MENDNGIGGCSKNYLNQKRGAQDGGHVVYISALISVII